MTTELSCWCDIGKNTISQGTVCGAPRGESILYAISGKSYLEYLRKFPWVKPCPRCALLAHTEKQ